eukprot:gene4661-5269_t
MESRASVLSEEVETRNDTEGYVDISLGPSSTENVEGVAAEKSVDLGKDAEEDDLMCNSSDGMNQTASNGKSISNKTLPDEVTDDEKAIGSDGMHSDGIIGEVSESKQIESFNEDFMDREGVSEVSSEPALHNASEDLSDKDSKIESSSETSALEDFSKALPEDAMEAVSNDKAEVSTSELEDSGGKSGTNAEDGGTESEPLDILGNGLLKKTVITKGNGEESRPHSGNEVVIRISGQLNDASCLPEEEITFVLDDREVIQALDLAVALMELGEKALLYTDAKYAYGTFGRKDEGLNVPSNSSITFEIELLSAREIELSNLSDQQLIDIGDRKRNRGNKFYSSGDYGSAIDCYKRALKYLQGSSNTEVREMHLKCQNNMSAAQLKINAYQAALLSCESVLRWDPDNVKAAFRKGKCLEGIGRSEDALKWMKKASMLDPNSKIIQAEMIRLGNYVKKIRQKETDMYKRMVDGLRDGKEEDPLPGEEGGFSWKLLAGTMVAAGVEQYKSFEDEIPPREETGRTFLINFKYCPLDKSVD